MSYNEKSIGDPKRKARSLDRLDLKILCTLHHRGRITKKEMGEEIGLSPTRCWERMRKMEDAKIIQGYHALIDFEALFGLSFYFTQVKILQFSWQRQSMFENFVKNSPEIVACHHVLGSVDYFLLIVARTAQHYQTIMESIAQNGSFDIDYTSFPVTRTVKQPFPMSFDEILASAARGQSGS